MPGPLTGIRIVEIAGIGPGPMACMLLADMGATVLQVTRTDDSGPGIPKPPEFDFILRGRKSVAIDLKHPDGRALVLDLCAGADGLVEGFRPGTMERLGLGPDDVFARNAALVYGRMTGFGQTGPLARAAGHDINYIALTGALHAIGNAGDKPVPPINLLGDFGGGSLYLAFGMVCALLEARRSGTGQVVDAAIVDGASSLMTMIYGLHAAGMYSLSRGENLLDGGSAIYDAYACADGEYISIGPIEPKFRAVLFDKLGLPYTDDEGPATRTVLEERFRAHDRQYWCDLLEGSDACFAPVLSMEQAPNHPHNVARGTFVRVGGQIQPAPAPRFSRSVPDLPTAPEAPGASGRAGLAEWGIDEQRIATLAASGAVVLPD
jgi:alpha-methylacyl-CoA racemase